MKVYGHGHVGSRSWPRLCDALYPTGAQGSDAWVKVCFVFDWSTRKVVTRITGMDGTLYGEHTGTLLPGISGWTSMCCFWESGGGSVRWAEVNVTY